MAELTPMMKQYFEIKEKNKDCILFFRLGDFYEMFGEDARTASTVLDLVLTSRDRSLNNPEDKIPMCGIPYHAADNYIARLIGKGFKVAVCEQLEDPALAKGLVKRDIIRIVTPGTLIESTMLDEGKANYLCTVFCAQNVGAVCFADLSTGEISISEFDGIISEKLENEIAAFGPTEAICNSDAFSNRVADFLRNKIECSVTMRDELFDYYTSLSLFSKYFPEEQNSRNTERRASICAVGALVAYLIETQKTELLHFNKLTVNSANTYMELDYQTIRSLELVASNRTFEKKGSLLWVLDKTSTPMGRRLIRSWVLRPLKSSVEINKRLCAVNALYSNSMARDELVRSLRGVGDIERTVSKIIYGSAGGRDLRALQLSCQRLPEILNTVSMFPESKLLISLSKASALEDIADLIGKAICDEPPFSIREGGFIRDGYSAEVDRLRKLLNNSTEILAGIESRERERTGKKLKIGYNRVFGYYIEIPRSASEDVPGDYVRKQTLANAERFITQELKALESELLSAKDRLADEEYSIFTKLREVISAEIERIQDAAKSVAGIDAICSLASVAAKNGYVMPTVEVSGTVDIKNGRHPVVEVMQKDSLFVPNDTLLNQTDRRALIVTGPNMAGKSTYMRQTALIVLMAQMGSFVPAASAKIGITDRIFTRIGASDDLSGGMSTFMVEMTEVADILKNATSQSLLILDEIGRGTSTYDGMAMARAVLEYCASKKTLGAKTMFATHYHELISAEYELDGVKNCCITAKKRGNDIIFLRKIVPGGADDSYGIEVAALAGVPKSVIARAKDVLKEINENIGMQSPGNYVHPQADDDQLSLGDLSSNEVADIIRNTDMNTITPIEALNILFDLKKKIENG